jgi:cell division protease FtsH
MTSAELERKMAVLLGGRAAEWLVFGHLSTGAADDLSKATEIARSMVTRYAMVPELGSMAYDDEPRGFLGMPGMPGAGRTYSEETAREIDCAVRDILDRVTARALRVLERNADTLERAAALLLEKETLDSAQLDEVFSGLAREEPASDERDAAAKAA